MACNEIGHTPKFWRIMEFMKQKAINYGIYKKTSFKDNPVPYCGIILNSGGWLKSNLFAILFWLFIVFF